MRRATSPSSGKDNKPLRSISITLVVGLICAGCGLAQEREITPGPGLHGFVRTQKFRAAEPYIMRSVVTGSPYSGEESDETARTLPDGTQTVDKQSPRKIYRDSMGRVRTETAAFPGMDFNRRGRTSPIVVEITDPVANVKYVLDTVNKVAHRQQLPPAAPPVYPRTGSLLPCLAQSCFLQQQQRQRNWSPGTSKE